MSEMVERMAAAFALSAVKREQPEAYDTAEKLDVLDGVLSADDPESLQTLANLRTDLRAALDAMRVPTEAMLEAGPGVPYMDRDVWAKMIDEALK